DTSARVFFGSTLHFFFAAFFFLARPFFFLLALGFFFGACASFFLGLETLSYFLLYLAAQGDLAFGFLFALSLCLFDSLVARLLLFGRRPPRFFLLFAFRLFDGAQRLFLLALFCFV